MQVPTFARDRVLQLLQASPNLSGTSVRVLMSSEQDCPDFEKLSTVIKVRPSLTMLWLLVPLCRQRCRLCAKGITCRIFMDAAWLAVLPMLLLLLLLHE